MKEKRVSTAAKYRKRTQIGEIWHRLMQNKGAVVGLIIISLIIAIAIFADLLVDYDTQVVASHVKERFQRPNSKYWFGTDHMGRDLFARVLYGTRYSLLIGISAVLFSFVIGVPFGSVCGFFGGKVDLFLMRIIDVLQAIPSTLLGIIVVSALGQSTTNLVIAIGLSQVAGVASITRASIMTVKNSEYVESSKAIGMTEFHIIIHHILPNCLSPIIVQLTLSVARAIVSASSLSFIGLGVPVPSPEWGALLSAGRTYIASYPYMTLFPGLAIMITVLSLNLLGDGLRDALDPKLRK